MMIDEYDTKSCNALQRPFYRPIEAAIRWCNLTAHEGTILQSLGTDYIPKTGQFPQWPCLQANTELILDAIENGELAYGRDGRTVPAGEHVRADRRTVRHSDLREWMARVRPGSKPAFLFDEVERNAHTAINADAFRALQADRDALKARIENATEAYRALKRDRDEVATERDSLRSTADKMAVPGERAEATYLNIIGAMLELLRNPRPGREESDAAVIRELIENYSDKPGISKTTLEAKFAEARRRLNST